MTVATNSVTSLTLLRRLRDFPDDQECWEEFVERYGAMICRWCRSWGLQEADALDVTQNVLLRIARHMRRFEYRAGGRFRSWLHTVARHAWVDYMESIQRPGGGTGDDAVQMLLVSVEAREEFLQQLDDEYDRGLLEEAMQRVAARVEPHTWQAFLAMAVEGRSGAEVAKQLGMKIGTVYVAKSKVQKMLREEIGNLEKE